MMEERIKNESLTYGSRGRKKEAAARACLVPAKRVVVDVIDDAVTGKSRDMLNFRSSLAVRNHGRTFLSRVPLIGAAVRTIRHN